MSTKNLFKLFIFIFLNLDCCLLQNLVIQTKSVEFMPFYLSLSTFLMSGSFFLYGLFNSDAFVYVSYSFNDCFCNFFLEYTNITYCFFFFFNLFQTQDTKWNRNDSWYCAAVFVLLLPQEFYSGRNKGAFD